MQIIKKHLGVLTLAATLVCACAFPVAPSFAKGDRNQNSQLQQLSPEQQTTAKRILKESRVETAPLREALKSKKAELDEQMQSAAPDRERVETLAREIGELQGKILVARIDMRNRLKQEGLPPNIFDKDKKNARKDVKNGKSIKKGSEPQKGSLDAVQEDKNVSVNQGQ